MRRLVGLVVLLVLLGLPAAAGVGIHATARAGANFDYYETVVLNGGTGNYTGYTENTYVNGTIAWAAPAPNGSANASYQNSNSWSNNQGQSEKWSSAGTFTFSTSSYVYLNGTDNQTGYTSPVYVWYSMKAGAGVGSQFYLLNSPMNVVSKDYSYELGGGSRYVETIFTEGNGSYQRNDDYGVFTASYNWKSYFDPVTGNIVGYVYTEHDTDGSVAGFTWTDTLYVTQTSYALTPAAAPPPSSSPYALSDVGVLVAVLFVIILIVVVVWIVYRSRRNRPRQLPQHAAPGNIGYGAPPPPFAPMGGAPSIHLTPSDQPVPQVVLRETVKVKCRYCGALIDVTDKTCPNCGAPLA
ncbi:MAG: zinc ribbon domain-containing protein [Thermoplasmata archaeon]